MNTIATIGHNSPPSPFEEIKTRIEDLYGEAKQWLDGEPVTTQDQANALNTLENRIREAAKEAEALRKGEVKPLDDAKAELFRHPLHAYTRGLLASIPRMETPRKTVLPVIPGMVASLKDFVPGCRFCQRMDRQGSTLRERPPFLETSPGHWVEACPICYVQTEA